MGDAQTEARSRAQMQRGSQQDAVELQPEMVQIVTDQLGTIEVPSSALITFPHGLLGFRDASSYCLLEVKRGSRFQLLQNAHRPKLAFVVIDPTSVEPDYDLEAVRERAQHVLLPEEPVGVACIVTVPPPPARPTVNLLAPLAMGSCSRNGVQVVLHDSPHRVRHEL